MPPSYPPHDEGHKFILVDNPWKLKAPAERKQKDWDHLQTWVSCMFRKDISKPLQTSVEPVAVYYVKTQNVVIVELPAHADLSRILGAHYWHKFLTGEEKRRAHPERDVSYVFEYNWEKQGDPEEVRKWNSAFSNAKIPRGIPIAIPYPSVVPCGLTHDTKAWGLQCPPRQRTPTPPPQPSSPPPLKSSAPPLDFPESLEEKKHPISNNKEENIKKTPSAPVSELQEYERPKMLPLLQTSEEPTSFVKGDPYDAEAAAEVLLRSMVPDAEFTEEMGSKPAVKPKLEENDDQSQLQLAFQKYQRTRVLPETSPQPVTQVKSEPVEPSIGITDDLKTQDDDTQAPDTDDAIQRELAAAIELFQQSQNQTVVGTKNPQVKVKSESTDDDAALNLHLSSEDNTGPISPTKSPPPPPLAARSSKPLFPPAHQRRALAQREYTPFQLPIDSREPSLPPRIKREEVDNNLTNIFHGRAQSTPSASSRRSQFVNSAIGSSQASRSGRAYATISQEATQSQTKRIKKEDEDPFETNKRIKREY